MDLDLTVELEDHGSYRTIGRQLPGCFHRRHERRLDDDTSLPRLLTIISVSLSMTASIHGSVIDRASMNSSPGHKLVENRCGYLLTTYH